MKKQILFVDDDPFLLRAYGMLLGDEGNRWEVWTAPGAAQALELLAQQRFDVVVSDLRMPGMSGAELTAEIQRRYPSTSRMIISGINDQDEIVQCLGTIHQFLPKPFDAKSLRGTLARICSLDAFLSDGKLKALVAQLGELPSFPSLYLEITKELASSIPSMERVAAIVAKDPAMTVKLLQLVNSTVFGLARKVSSTFDAVQFLGIGTVRSLALTMHVFANFERVHLKCFSIAQLWEHSLRTGLLARALMRLEQADSSDAEDAYVAGMLHDLGKLMLAHSRPEQFQQAHELAHTRGLPLSEAELEVFGATHSGAGAYLLGLWGLPAPIVEAVAFHNRPGLSDLRAFSPLTAVHAADVLEREFSQNLACGQDSGLDLEYLESLGVASRLEAWRAEAQRVFQAQPEEPEVA